MRSFGQLLQELGEMPQPGGTPDLSPSPLGGGGQPPIGGSGGMGGMGMGGIGGMPPPMGGGSGNNTPVPVKTVSVSDVWKILSKFSKDENNSRFFDEINIAQKPEQAKVFQKKKENSLFK